MARDAIARQYDVDKNGVQLVCEPGTGNYRPGTITFFAKKGKVIDLDKIQESLRATWLSGSTNMEVTSLLVTAVGRASASATAVMLKVAGTDRPLILEDAAGKGDGTAFRRLRELLAKGEQTVMVTGYVPGWEGKFPAMLRTLAADAAAGKPLRLLVTEFQLVKE